MLAHRLRRWANIITTLGERVVYTVLLVVLPERRGMDRMRVFEMARLSGWQV